MPLETDRITQRSVDSIKQKSSLKVTKMLSNMSEIQSPHNNPSSAVEYTENHEFIKLVDKKV